MKGQRRQPLISVCALAAVLVTDQAQAQAVEWKPYPHSNHSDILEGSFVAGEAPALRDDTVLTHSRATGEYVLSARWSDYATNNERSPRPMQAPQRRFSTADARKCVAGKKIIFAGDSYTENMYIGLTDILMENITDGSFTPHERRVEMMRRAEILGGEDAGIFSGLLFERECGHMTISCYEELIRTDSDRRMAWKKADAVILSNLIHSVKASAVEEYITKENQRGKLFDDKTVGRHAAHADYAARLLRLLELLQERYKIPVTWLSGAWYGMVKMIPEQYQASQKNNELMPLNTAARDAVVSHGGAFLDVLSMDKACITAPQWGNCTVDGTHLVRMGGRAAAQLLLNHLCPAGKVA